MDTSYDKLARYTKLIVAILLAAIVYSLSQVFIILFLAFIFSSFLLPLVNKVSSWHVHRIVASITVVLLFVAIPIGLLVLLSIPLTDSLVNFFRTLPQLAQQVANQLNLEGGIAQQVGQYASQLGNAAVSITTSIAEVASAALITLVVTVYMLIYYNSATKTVIDFAATSKAKAKQYATALRNIESRLRGWAKGQVLLSLVVGILSWLTYTIIGLPFAPVLGLIAGLFEFVPNIGPLLAVIPALLIAITISPETLIAATIGYTLIQAAESYFLAPKIVSSATKFNPFAILIAVLVSGYLFGIIGILIAVPILVVATEVHKASRRSTEP